MRSFLSKLLSGLLALFFVLSLFFSASADLWRPQKTKKVKDLDEHPNPGVAGKPRYFILLTSANSVVVVPLFIKPTVPSAKSLEKPFVSPPSDESIQ